MSKLSTIAFSALLPETRAEIFDQYYVVVSFADKKEGDLTLVKAQSWQEALRLWLYDHAHYLGYIHNGAINTPSGSYVPELTWEESRYARQEISHLIAWCFGRNVYSDLALRSEWRDKIAQFLTDTTITENQRQLRYYGVLEALNAPTFNGRNTFLLRRLSEAEFL